jgi:hypothetical protein
MKLAYSNVVYNFPVEKRLRLSSRMGTAKSRAICRLHCYVSELKAVFIHDGRVLFCQACRKSGVSQQLSQVTQHVGGIKHVANVVVLKFRLGGRSLICESSDVSFVQNLPNLLLLDRRMQGIMVAYMPLNNISNPEVRNFLRQILQMNPTSKELPK